MDDDILRCSQDARSSLSCDQCRCQYTCVDSIFYLKDKNTTEDSDISRRCDMPIFSLNKDTVFILMKTETEAWVSLNGLSWEVKNIRDLNYNVIIMTYPESSYNRSYSMLDYEEI